MGTFRARKPWNIIPGLVRINFSGSKTRGKKARGGASVTFHIGKWVGWNTKTGRVTVNTPGAGSWQSDPHKPTRGRRAPAKTATPRRASASKPDPGVEQDAQLWAQHFAGIRAQGGEDAAYQAAKAAGRCPTHGTVLPPGSWCRPCAQAAAERHAAADRGGDAPGTSRRAASAPPPWGTPPAAAAPASGGSPAGARTNAIDQYWQAVDDDGNMSPERRRLIGARPAAPEQQGGTCGAKTQDGTPCRNGAGCSIAAHRRKRPAGASR